MTSALRSLRRSTPLSDMFSDVFGDATPPAAPSTLRSRTGDISKIPCVLIDGPRREEAVQSTEISPAKAASSSQQEARLSDTELDLVSSKVTSRVTSTVTEISNTGSLDEKGEGTQEFLDGLAEALGISDIPDCSAVSALSVKSVAVTSVKLRSSCEEHDSSEVADLDEVVASECPISHAGGLAEVGAVEQDVDAPIKNLQSGEQGCVSRSPSLCWWEMPLGNMQPAEKRPYAHDAFASPSPLRKRCRGNASATSASIADAHGPVPRVAEQPAEEKEREDDWLAKLMKRRAERNAPDLPAAAAEGLVGAAKASATKAERKAARLSATEALQAQLSELARIRSAAEAAGWQAGFMDEPRALEPAPLAPLAAAAQSTGGPARGRGIRAGRAAREATAARTDPLPSADLTRVLEEVRLPVDVACAARASDAWHAEQQALLTEAARACRRSKAEGPEAAEEALAVLQSLRQRAKDEPGRRALMRSCGVCPKTAVFEKASIGRSGEGRLSARTIANEFEAKTFLPSVAFADRIEATKPGCLGEWHHLDEGHVELLSRSIGYKDFGACAETAARLGACAGGLYVGRLALAGLTREYPFLVRGGLSHFVCGVCNRWVSRQDARQHNVRCVGDVAGRPRVFRQPCGEGLGLTLGFKHLPKLGVVEMQADAAVDAAIRRACWACYWSPDALRCSWRMARRPPKVLNTFPIEEPPDSRRRRPAKDGGCGESEGSGCSGDEADVKCISMQEEQDAGHCSVAATFEPNRASDKTCIDNADVSKGFSNVQSSLAPSSFALQSSYKVKPAEQPWSFVQPLTVAQLHSLGWMRQREESEDVYVSKHLLREAVAETDVCLEIRLEREFQTARGGILADALGYGKTACMIALIAETRQQSIQEFLNLGQWPKIAGQRVLTNATLVVTPVNLFDQWLREIRKFVVSTSGLAILAVPSHSKLKTLTVADFVAADIVLVSFRLFFSEAYQRYFDELTKPGLKVWDEGSVQRRQAYCKKRKAAHGKAKGTGKRQGLIKEEQSYSSVKRESELDHETAMPTQGRVETDGEHLRNLMKPEPGKTEFDASAGDLCECEAFDDFDADTIDLSSAPALQLSRYYLEMRASKDYLPQRYIDLERRTRRLLRETESAEELAQSPALFEMFYFKRVVFDEFHEVVQMSSKQATGASSTARVPFYALHALEGRAHWGLTATPFLSSAAAVAHMASLMRVFVPHDDDGEAQRFLDTWVTSNTWDDSVIPLREHWVEVELTAVERALYVHQRNILSDQGCHAPDSAHARSAERRLLQLCTHFDPEGCDSEASVDARTALEQQLKRTRGLLEQAVSRLNCLEAQREELITRRYAFDRLHAVLPDMREAPLACAHCDLSEVHSLTEAALQASDARVNSELALVEADLRRLAQAAVDGQPPAVTPHVDKNCEPCRRLATCEERVKHLNRSKGHTQGDQRQAETQLRFLEAVFESLEASEADHIECPECLRDAPPSATTILPCGHRLHVTCAASVLAAEGRCPQCRRPAALQACTAVATLRPPAVAPVAVLDEQEALRRQYGSKLTKVIQTIQDIKKNEGDSTKCLVFVQWECVSAQLERGLKAVGISPQVLRGNLAQRQKALTKFVDGRTSEASVLLLSLEHSPSGMNLAGAHHVLLVHPMHADSCEAAASHEAQAIGRVRRRGQSQAVHVHRFVSKGTVEEALARQHRDFCQQRRPAANAA